MSDTTQRSELHKKISDFMFAFFHWATHAGNASLEPKMHALAVDLLEYQRLNHPLYQKYCTLHGISSRRPSFLDYPPLPVESFKRADICPFPDDLTAAEFRSSGTTENIRSIHKFRDMSLLDSTLIYAFTMFIARKLPPKMRLFSLMPSHNDNPHSSLGYMISKFIDIFGDDHSDAFFSPQNGLQCDRLIDALKTAEKERVPVHLMGPAFAYVELLDHLGAQSISCAPGSCLLETGGYKGKSREIPKPELRNMLSAHLGIDRHCIYGEYGMCELSSQGYECCALNSSTPLDESLYIFPGWLKCIVLDPDTMAPLLPGHEGQIAFFDLCNLDSAAYILTGDIGALVPLPANVTNATMTHPKFALKLKGRAPNAVPKGCSIAWDEWQTAAQKTKNADQQSQPK